MLFPPPPQAHRRRSCGAKFSSTCSSELAPVGSVMASAPFRKWAQASAGTLRQSGRDDDGASIPPSCLAWSVGEVVPTRSSWSAEAIGRGRICRSSRADRAEGLFLTSGWSPGAMASRRGRRVARSARSSQASAILSRCARSARLAAVFASSRQCRANCRYSSCFITWVHFPNS